MKYNSILNSNVSVEEFKELQLGANNNLTELNSTVETLIQEYHETLVNTPQVIDPIMENEMKDLFQSIEFLLPNFRNKIIQFIGSNGGEGVSTIVREYATILVKYFDMSILLVDSDINNLSQFKFYNLNPRHHSIDKSFRDEIPIEEELYNVPNSNLFVGFLSILNNTTSNTSDFKLDFNLPTKLKQRFDYILIDSAPAIASSTSHTFSSWVDGIVLVLEAEKTSKLKVEIVKNKILKNGGNILGILFNKQRYHIPDYIYKYL